MSLSTELSMNAAVRPLMAGGLAAGYLYYRSNFTNLDFKNAGLVAGSVWVAEMTANVALPRVGAFSSNKGVKSMEHMVAAPLLTGLLYSQSYRYFYPGDDIPMSKLVMLGAAVDVASDKMSTPFKYMLQPDLPDEF